MGAKFRALCDSGASISIINDKIYQLLLNTGKFKRVDRNPIVKTANNQQMNLTDYVSLTFTASNLVLEHEFAVIKSVNRPVILGRDFMRKYHCRMYFDLNLLRIGKTYVPLIDDKSIQQCLRTIKSTLIPPQSRVQIAVVSQAARNAKRKQTYFVSELSDGFLAQYPDVNARDCVVRPKRNGKCVLEVINTSGGFVKIHRGTPLARLENIEEVYSVNFGNNTSSKDISADLNGPRPVTKLDLSKIDTPDEHYARVRKLLSRNQDVFATSDLDLGFSQTIQMQIHTPPGVIVKKRPYRLPLAKQQIAKDAIDQMLAAGVIEKSRSNYCSPIVLVTKKDGSTRFAVDYRQLNSHTKAYSYYLPQIDDILNDLRDSTVYTSLDLKNAFWQLKMAPEDKEKTAFSAGLSSGHALYQFTRMPFGLKNSPSYFQELMGKVLEGIPFARAYVDDVIIYSKNIDEHVEHIEIVFQRLREHGLKLKLPKCQFLTDETKYLGFVVNAQGIKPDPDKIRAIKNLPRPTTVKEVRAISGLLNYYRRFLPNLSSILRPLTELTKKYARFHWTDECQAAFDFIKTHVCTVPILSFPDPNKPYIIHTDASNYGIGAVLSQKTDDGEKPIYFFSQKLSDTQRRWSVIERECFAILTALKKFDHYIHGTPTTLFTDHKPLEFLLRGDIQNPRIANWSVLISAYDLEIKHISGVDNNLADLLSRAPQSTAKLITEKDLDMDDRTLEITKPTEKLAVVDTSFVNPHLCELENPSIPDLRPEVPALPYEMRTEQSKDATIREIIKQLKSPKVSKSLDKHYIIQNEVLYYISDDLGELKIRLVVPSHLRDLVVKQFHDYLGHSGSNRTYATARSQYFWPTMAKTIEQYVSKCVTCQERNLKAIKSPVGASNTVSSAWYQCSADLIGPWPATPSGNKYVLSIIDWFSNYVLLYPLADKTADSVARVLTTDVFCKHGAMNVLVTDNGKEFVNETLKDVLDTYRVKHVTTSFYNPAANGKCERSHRTLGDILSKLCNGKFDQWDVYLSQAEACLNFHVNHTGYSSYFLFYNRDPKFPINNVLKPRPKYYGDQEHKMILENQHRIFRTAHRVIKHTQGKRLAKLNENLTLVELQVGDPVYLKNNHRANKLDSRWTPFWRVLERLSEKTYLIKNQLNVNLLYLQCLVWTQKRLLTLLRK